jgi:metallophosphoesterase (TIGR00282 family)
MNIMILGDIVGAPGRDVLRRKINGVIKDKKIDFLIVNGENAADDGKGVTKEIVKEFYDLGVDVVTSGNHIWDKSEIVNYISDENRLLRPANLADGSPGKGYEVYLTKDKKFKVAVINLMGNVFMRKTEDVFISASKIQKQIKLQESADFIVVDFHGEITSEKMAMGHFFDGKATMLVGTHTHVPTADSRILTNGTAYQTDIGMCGVYDSVIGMNKENSIKKFLKQKDSVNHFPAQGKATLSGLIVEADKKTGLAKKIERYIGGEVF